MTNAQSPEHMLREQANMVAEHLKVIKRNDRDSIVFGVAMDDKLLQIEMAWAVIDATSVEALTEFILREMQDRRSVQ